jgi:hypothetical protein
VLDVISPFADGPGRPVISEAVSTESFASGDTTPRGRASKDFAE